MQSRPAIDFTLRLGQSTQVVEVSSAAPVLQTETADVGGVVQGEQINDLPLNGRRYSDLALLEAGIQRNQVNRTTRRRIASAPTETSKPKIIFHSTASTTIQDRPTCRKVPCR